MQYILMLHLKSNFQILVSPNTTRTRVMCLPLIRSFASTVVTKKNYASNNQRRTSTCQEKDNVNGDSQDSFVANTRPSTSRYNLSFMPVVNIPQTEFAYSSFFSLQRPLLGLADGKETKFFSSQSIADENVDEQLANYMTSLTPFVVPAPPGSTPDQQEDCAMITNSTTYDLIEMEENYYLEQLPMYHMPESEELVEYLSNLQERLSRQGTFDDITTASTLGRTKRRQISASSNKQQGSRSARFPKRKNQGFYRHRWNK